MNWEYKPLEYKKTDGIHAEDRKLTKWQKFVLYFGEFLGKGLAGKWEIKFKIKF